MLKNRRFTPYTRRISHKGNTERRQSSNGSIQASRSGPRLFGSHYLPHYFSLPPPPFHRQLDQLWRKRVMKGGNPLSDAAGMLGAKGTRSAVAAPWGHAKSTVMSLKNVLHAALYGYKNAFC